MDDLQVKNLKLVDAHISAMLTLQEPPTEEIEKYIGKMQQLFEEASSGPLFGDLKIQFWNCRLDLLKNELKSLTEFNKLEKGLFALQYYIQTLFSIDPTNGEIKQNIDKLIEKVKQIDAGSFKTKWTQVTESLLEAYIELQSPQSSDFASCDSSEDKDNCCNRSRSNSTSLDGPALPSPNVSKPVSFYFKIAYVFICFYFSSFRLVAIFYRL